MFVKHSEPNRALVSDKGGIYSFIQKKPPATILKFLDEQTTLTEELRIMASVPSFPFLAAVLDVSRKRLLEKSA
jgi:hypothetical protein